MAYTIALTDLTTTINLLDKVSYKALMGLLVDPVEARVRLHIPDSGEARVIDIDDNDRVAVMPVHFLGAGDTALNSLVTVRRWIDGASSQAVRYELLGDVKPIYLKLQRNGATNATIHRIKWGRVNDASGPYSQTAHISGPVAARLTLVLAPYGELQTPITYRNDLENGDMTLSDGDTGNGPMASEWTRLGNAVADLSTSIWLINGQSQEIVTSAAGDDGTFSDLYGSSLGALYKVNAFVWVCRTAGADDISFETQDDLGDIRQVQLDDGGWDTYTDPRGQTWSRLELGVTLQDAAISTVRLRVVRRSADASEATTYYVDGAYLDVTSNSIAFPASGWTSYRNLLNRGDQTLTNPENINWFDTWGMPGDAPAQALWKVTTGATATKAVIAGRMIDGKQIAVNQQIWVDSGDFSAQTGGTWTQRADAARSGGAYEEFLAGAAPDSGSISWQFTGDAARQLMVTPRRVYCIVRTDDTANTSKLKLGVLIDATQFVNNTQAENIVVAGSVWQAVDLGVLNLSGLLADVPPDTTDPTVNLSVSLSNVTNTKQVEIDALHFVPIEDEFILYEIQSLTELASGSAFWLDGPNKIVVAENRALNEYAALGSLWHLVPGYLTNRVTFQNQQDTLPTHNLTTTFAIDLLVTPRTRHLLGTL